jgi:hypothetical protein
MTDKIALLPCPFCGNDNPLPMTGYNETFWIRCDACSAESSICNNGPMAIELWNNRSSPKTDDEAISDKEIADFQDDVRSELLSLLSNAGIETDIDGGGCDSGAWQDFTLSEITQGFNRLADHYYDKDEEQAEEIARLRYAITRMITCDGDPVATPGNPSFCPSLADVISIGKKALSGEGSITKKPYICPCTNFYGNNKPIHRDSKACSDAAAKAQP